MLVRLLACAALCAALTGTPAFAGWNRYVDSFKGGFTDSPPAHPLTYFLVDPCMRPDSDPLGRALECTWVGAPPPSPAELERRANLHPDLVEVGKIGEFTIYDLWYRRGNLYPNNDVRSVLVETAPDEFREIATAIRRGETFPSSEIVTLDGEPILIIKSHDGGNNDRIDKTLYMFRKDGPELPDFTAVRQAAIKLMPANMSIRTETDDFASMTHVVETYRSDLNQPPVTVKERGRITVSYRFVEGRAVVTNSKYEAHSLQ
jgi:hypothetical protein